MKTPTPQNGSPTRATRKRAALLAITLAVLFSRTAGQAQAPNALPYSTGYLVTGDYIAAGVDLTPQLNPPDGNGMATGTIHVANVPPLADIQAAYLYFEVIHSATVDPLAGVKFRGSTLVPDPTKLVGIRKVMTTSLGGNNLSQCWGAAGGSGSVLTMVRADVLHLLPKLFDKDNQWTGKRLVNDSDLGPSGNLDTQGQPYPLHTVTLREGAGDQAMQSAGATLLVIYRVPTDPLKKVVIYDGVFTPPEGAAISQTISGFYKHTGDSARLTYIGGSGANNQTEALSFNGVPVSIADPFPQTSPSSDRSWANTLIPLTGMSNATTGTAYGETVSTTLTQSLNPKDCKALGAIVFSTQVLDADNDGLPDGLEDAPGGLLNPNGEQLPDLNGMGASSLNNHKDLFVEVNAMKADNATVATPYPNHDHMPADDVLKLVGDAYAAHGITPHFDVGNKAAYGATYGHDADAYLVEIGARGGEQILERPCVPTSTVKCQFPNYPGTVAWKFGLQEYRDAPVGANGEDGGVLNLTPAQQAYCQTNPHGTIDGLACDRRRFDRIRSSLFHYALYAHARARPVSPFPCLAPGTPPTPAEYDATGQCGTPLVDNPDYHVPKSISGTADLPGGNLMITLGLWENFVGTPYVQASTTLHELGHNLDLWHGGLPLIPGSKKLNTANYFEPNCKPNYLSSMSYLFQVHGLYQDDGSLHLDYSGVANGTAATPPALPLPNINETSLEDGGIGPGMTTPAYRLAWFVPSLSALATDQSLSAATKFCSGKFNPSAIPAAMARVEAETTASSIDWNGDNNITASNPTQNVNFDGTFYNEKTFTGGVPIISTAMFGYDDWSNLHLNQIGAGRGSARFSIYAPSGSTFEGSTFEGSTFEGSTFEGSTFEGSTFEGSTFEGSTFEGSTFEGSTFEGSTFEGSTFEGSTFEGSTFEGQELDAKTAHKIGRVAPHAFKACVLGGSGLDGCVGAWKDNSGAVHAAQPVAGDPLFHRIYTKWDETASGQLFKFHVSRRLGTSSTKVEVQSSPTANTWLVDTEEYPNGLTLKYSATAEYNDETPNQSSGDSNKITLTTVNVSPAAVADAGAVYTAHSAVPSTLVIPTVPTVPSLFANDTDPDSPATSQRICGATLASPSAMCGVLVTVGGVTPAKGTVTVSADGQTFSYTPKKNYTGPDSFTYKVNGGKWPGDLTTPMSGPDSTVVTVSITVIK